MLDARHGRARRRRSGAEEERHCKVVSTEQVHSGRWVYLPLAATTVRVVANTGVAIAISARRARAGAVTAARVLCLDVSSCFPGKAAHAG